MERRTLKVYLPCLAGHVYQLVKVQHGWPSDDAHDTLGGPASRDVGVSTPRQRLYSSLQQRHGLLVRSGTRCSFALQSMQANGLEEDHAVGSFVGCQLDWSSQRFGGRCRQVGGLTGRRSATSVLESDRER